MSPLRWPLSADDTTAGRTVPPAVAPAFVPPAVAPAFVPPPATPPAAPHCLLLHTANRNDTAAIAPPRAKARRQGPCVTRRKQGCCQPPHRRLRRTASCGAANCPSTILARDSGCAQSSSESGLCVASACSYVQYRMQLSATRSRGGRNAGSSACGHRGALRWAWWSGAGLVVAWGGLGACWVRWRALQGLVTAPVRSESCSVQCAKTSHTGGDQRAAHQV